MDGCVYVEVSFLFEADSIDWKQYNFSEENFLSENFTCLSLSVFVFFPSQRMGFVRLLCSSVSHAWFFACEQQIEIRKQQRIRKNKIKQMKLLAIVPNALTHAKKNT